MSTSPHHLEPAGPATLGSKSALASHRCVVVGAGGLGHPVIAGLLSLGVRTFVLIDPDEVEPSNLHRQWLFSGADRYRNKAEVAAQWLQARDRDLAIEVRTQALIPNAAPIPDPQPQDFWFECSDQPRLKFALAAQALRESVPCVIGGVLRWHGQVFAQRVQSGCYACLFEAPPAPGSCDSCERAGVMTSAAAHIGQLMVAQAEALARTADQHPLTPNTLVHHDLLAQRTQVIRAPRKRDCCHCGPLASRAALR